MPSYDLVISHANCFDGLTAAWVACGFLGDSAQYVFATHGDPPPDVTGKRVLIVDFSYPREVLEAMFAQAESLLVLDHHASAEKALAGLPYVEFDMNRSGAGLAWDHFYPGKARPPIVAHVEDRDLWRFAIPGTREYHCAMTTYPLTFEAWDEISRRSLFELIDHGRSILKFSNVIGEKFAARAGTVLIGDVKCWSTNTPVEFVGEAAEALHQRQDEYGNYLPVLAWSYDHQRKDWYCSLRSRPDGIDVSELATKFKGGGHPHAAGFRLKESPCLRTSFELDRLSLALGMLSTLRRRPQMFASMREAFVAQVWTIVFMVGVDADVQDFYKKVLGRQGCAVLGLDVKVDTEWARGVIDEAVALLPMDAAGWIAQQQETD